LKNSNDSNLRRMVDNGVLLKVGVAV